MGPPAPSAIDPDLGRRAATLKRSLGEVEIAVLGGDAVEEAAADVVRGDTSATVQALPTICPRPN